MTTETAALLTSETSDNLAIAPNQNNQACLLSGEVLLTTRSHSAWGGSVTAQMYLPLARSRVWQQVTDYPRWVQFFPDLVKSEILATVLVTLSGFTKLLAKPYGY